MEINNTTAYTSSGTANFVCQPSFYAQAPIVYLTSEDSIKA